MKASCHVIQQSSVTLFLALVWIIAATAPAAHYTATWTNGEGTENYSDPNNWDIDQVPLNLLDTFDVIIPAGFTVYFGIDNPGFVTDLDLASTSALIIEPGHSLTALDDVTLDGTVQADGSVTDFIATSAGTTLGDGATLYAANGGSIECAAASYSSKTLESDVTLFSADGYGSRIDLSAMQSLDARFIKNYRTQRISATNLGVIDLSELGTFYGSNSSLSLLNIYIGSGGFINFYYLTDILGGYTKFDIDIPYYAMPSLETALQTTFNIDATTILSLPALHTAEKCTFTIPDGAIVNAPALTNLLNCQISLNPNRTFVNGGLSNLDNSTIALTEGMQFGTGYGDITATSYASTARTDDAALFSATGVDTILDLSSFETLNAAINTNYRTQTISATENGLVDLSSLGTVYGSVTSLSRLKFFLDTDGDIDLSALQDIPSGYTTFDINIPSWSLPVLQNAYGITFDLAETTLNLPQLTTLDHSNLVLADGTAFNAPLLTSFTFGTMDLNPSRTFVNGTLTRFDNTTIALSGGKQFGTATGDINTTTYSSTGLSSNITIFSAAGVDTILDLSCLETLNAAFTTNYRTQTISATDNGLIDLSSLGTLYGCGSSLSTIKFAADTGGDIDLSSLQDIPSGYTTFDIDIPSWSLPLLQTATGITFDASATTTLNLPELTTLTNSKLILADGATFNAPLLTHFTSGILNLNPARTFINGTLTNIDNTQIALSGGIEFGVATGDLDITAFTSTGLNNNYTVLSVDGTDTVLDMSTVQSINAAFTANYRTQVFSVANNATWDLSGLGLFTGSASSVSSRSKIIVDSGAQLLTGDNLAFAGYAELNINGSGSQVTTTGDLTINQTSNFFATDSAVLSLAGGFFYHQMSETAFNADAGVIRFDAADAVMLEVGGANLGLGGATSGNFGIGRLVVGNMQPTTLLLVDLADNQNDGANNEALYLYGSGGMEALRIGPDSTLTIGNIDVYATVGGVMTHINSLFTGGVKWIPFDEGKITLTEYDCTLAADLTGDCFVGLADFAVMAAEWLHCGDLDCP